MTTNINSTPANKVIRDFIMVAGGLKFAAYRVQDGLTDEWSERQYHMTYMPQSEIAGRTMASPNEVVVCAMMSEAIAEDFITFVQLVEKTPSAGPNPYYVSDGPGYGFRAYKRTDGHLEFQVRNNGVVLAVMLSGMAKLFCTCVARTLKALNPQPAPHPATPPKKPKASKAAKAKPVKGRKKKK